MKFLKTLLATALVATFATAAHAQSTVVFRITGSTAYRGATVNAISNIWKGGSFKMAYSGTSGATAASDCIFSGTSTLSGTDTPAVVICHWTGSEGGIQTVAGGSTVNHANFLPTSTPMSTGTAAGENNTTNVTGGTSGATGVTDSQIPDACMSDTYQAASQFLGTYHSVTYAALKEDQFSPVGVNPFVFVAGGGTNATATFTAPASGITPTNITTSIAKELFTVGAIPMSFFTNNSLDTADTATVVAIGRDSDSGTRLTTLADIGLTTLTPLQQYAPLNSSTAIIQSVTSQGIDDIQPWPLSTVDTIVFAVGDGGYSGGGGVAAALASTFDQNVGGGVFMVGYVGTSDATTAIKAGAKLLSFNGVTLPYNTGAQKFTDFSAIQNGTYSFWGYEHMYYRNATQGTQAQFVADKIASDLLNHTAIIPLNSMNVNISSDGGTIGF